MLGNLENNADSFIVSNNIGQILFDAIPKESVVIDKILKIKTMDLLSDNTYWKLIRENKTIDVKILDSDWLEKYHNRQFVIQPNDYLKLQLKITYTINQNFDKPKVTYEAIKVYEIIPPKDIEDNGQVNMFE